ncbi:MAG: hypothetical protein WC792_02150 [Candidatus Micrarchaeia archaeon]|jgi:hypothetical protein
MSNSELLERTALLRELLSRGAISQLKELGGESAGTSFLREDGRFIAISVVAYAAAKFFEKPYIAQSNEWKKLILELDATLGKGVAALEKGQEAEFAKYLDSAVAGMQGLSKSLGRFVVNVVDKARIKAATQIYAHGASLGAAAELGNVDKKELSNYIGQTTLSEKYQTVDLKKRLKAADELFA